MPYFHCDYDYDKPVKEWCDEEWRRHYYERQKELDDRAYLENTTEDELECIEWRRRLFVGPDFTEDELVEYLEKTTRQICDIFYDPCMDFNFIEVNTDPLSLDFLSLPYPTVVVRAMKLLQEMTNREVARLEALSDQDLLGLVYDASLSKLDLLLMSLFQDWLNKSIFEIDKPFIRRLLKRIREIAPDYMADHPIELLEMRSIIEGMPFDEFKRLIAEIPPEIEKNHYTFWSSGVTSPTTRWLLKEP